jgi:hypothetical protein
LYTYYDIYDDKGVATDININITRMFIFCVAAIFVSTHCPALDQLLKGAIYTLSSSYATL